MAGGVPELDLFPGHARLCNAGPVTWLSHYCVFAGARHAEVRVVLPD